MPKSPLRALPSVNVVLQHAAVSALVSECGRELVLGWIRELLDETRAGLADGVLPADREVLMNRIVEQLEQRSVAREHERIDRVINATGVVLHTGLGRAPLSAQSEAALVRAAGATNVEIDLLTAERRYRGHQLLSAWQTLTGCEDVLLVNNNAAATVLTLQGLCAGKEVILSRGQMIEIGGSFRLPEIFELSGAVLREIGTTNRTTAADYEKAIGPETAAIMHVHPSNYRVIGFSQTPSIHELTPIARKHGIIAIDDIGSGALIDMTTIGLPPEPTFIDSVKAGADVILGSGDKLLGGPQAGIIIGKSACVERVRKHPLARAVRVDKLALAALSATLDSYLRGAAVEEIPTLRMLAAKDAELLKRAHVVCDSLGDVRGCRLAVSRDISLVGGGSLPAIELPTAVLTIEHDSVGCDELARRLRTGSLRLFPRIQDGRVVVDFRSILSEDDSKVELAIRLLDGSID